MPAPPPPPLGTPVDELETPCLLVDLDAFESNVKWVIFPCVSPCVRVCVCAVGVETSLARSFTETSAASMKFHRTFTEQSRTGVHN